MSELITSASELLDLSLQLGNLIVVTFYCSARHDDAEAEHQDREVLQVIGSE